MTSPDVEALRRQLELAAEELAPEIGLRFRAMFGGVGVYGRDRMFASLSDAGLALKLSPPDRSALLAEEGARPLQYEEDGPASKEYVVVPSRIRGDAAALAEWVRRSVDHASAALVSKRKRSSRREA